jgi:hypothetical protein
MIKEKEAAYARQVSHEGVTGPPYITHVFNHLFDQDMNVLARAVWGDVVVPLWCQSATFLNGGWSVEQELPSWVSKNPAQSAGRGILQKRFQAQGDDAPLLHHICVFLLVTGNCACTLLYTCTCVCVHVSELCWNITCFNHSSKTIHQRPRINHSFFPASMFNLG